MAVPWNFVRQAAWMRMRLFLGLARLGASTTTTTAWSANPERSEPLPWDADYAADENSTEQVTLSDGRKLGVAYYGAKMGPAVFFLHGYPGCRFSGGLFFDGPGKRLGARIISVERPGIGNSSPQPGRTIVDHADDIRQVADHLHLESYGVIGVSGGGPYALACAYALPEEKLKSVSVICGMGSVDVGLGGMNWNNWLYFMGFLYCPFVMRWLNRKIVQILNTTSNEKLVEATRKAAKKPQNRRLLNPDAAEALDNPAMLNTMLDNYREHYKQGIDVNMEEGQLLTRDWGFRLENIRPTLPMQLWYSKADTNVPIRMGQTIAARLKCRPEFYTSEDDTHLSLATKCRTEALERLLENMK